MDDPKRIANQVADAYMAAAAALDVDGFMSLYDPGARVFDLWTTWSYDGSTAWRQAVEAWFESVGTEQVVVTFDDVRAVGSGDVIVAHGFVGYAATADGVPQRDDESPHLGAHPTRTRLADRARAHVGADRRVERGDPRAMRRMPQARAGA